MTNSIEIMKSRIKANIARFLSTDLSNKTTEEVQMIREFLNINEILLFCLENNRIYRSDEELNNGL